MSIFRNLVLAFACILVFNGQSIAITIDVAPGESIQTAIDGAAPGDIIQLAAGTYQERINFNGKAITVRGVGNDTILDGQKGGSVVTFSSGEASSSVLDRVLVTRGLAEAGGGIFIQNSAPTITRCTIRSNKARGEGSGIYIEGRNESNNSPSMFNNLIARNSVVNKRTADAHAIEIKDSSPGLINNTIIKNDSNGILVSGESSIPQIRNNIIAFNGTRKKKFRRGRGICLVNGATLGMTSRLDYNLFFRNIVSDILANGTDFKRIADAEAELALTDVTGNQDANPKFEKLKKLDVSLRENSPAIDMGNPDLIFFGDLDNSRNDIGLTGGLFAHPSF